VSGIPAPEPSKYLRREMDPAAREFYRRLGAEATLATTRCERCEVTAFPPRLRCAQCGGAQVWVELPRTGRLHAFTTQETSVRFGPPTVLALADVGGVVLPGVVDAPYDSLAIGQEVTIELREEPDTGLTLLAFEPG